jgi:sugar lactone lactonase YvrE
MDTRSQTIHPFAGSGREGTRDGLLDVAELAQPSDLTWDGKGHLYFADSEGSSIRRIETDRGKGGVTTLAGSGASLFDYGDVDGIGGNARLQHPLGVVYYKGMLYVADTYNHKIKRLDPETREIRTFLGGQGGWRDGTDPLFYEPGGIDAAGDRLYIADTNNHCLRVVDLATHQTSTLVLEGIEQFTA